MEQTEITKEHQWLQKFVGEWKYEGRCPGGPDGSEVEFSGSERIEEVGGVWIHIVGEGDMAGTQISTRMTVGYDTRAKNYVGTWIGSMMTHQFVYKGWVEEDGRTLVLESSGPGMSDPNEDCTYRDINEFKSDDHRAFRSEMLNEDGSWTQIMSIDLFRVASA